MGLTAHMRRRWNDPHKRQALGVGATAILSGAALASLILNRFHLYSSSFTMTLVGLAAAVVAVFLLWLLEKRRYGWAWVAAIVLPPAIYLGFLRMLEANPPIPPLG